MTVLTLEEQFEFRVLAVDIAAANYGSHGSTPNEYSDSIIQIADAIYQYIASGITPHDGLVKPAE